MNRRDSGRGLSPIHALTDKTFKKLTRDTH